MAVTTASMTFEEFEQLPDEPNSLELLEGELIRMPPPEAMHQESSERLFESLKATVEPLRFAGAAIGKVHHEMGYQLSKRSWLQPDVSIRHPNQPLNRYYQGSPMLVFEIVSPNDSAADLEEKVEQYLKYGALDVWVIYPKSRHAIVHDSNSQTRRETHAIRSPHLPGIEIPFDQFL